MNAEFIQALNEIQKDKGVSKESIIDALEKALIKSYEKNYNDHQNVKVEIDHEKGNIKVLAEKTIVEVVEDEVIQISINDAKKINSSCMLGDQILVLVTPYDFGRIAAQTARNIVMQKIKDAEKLIIFNEFINKEFELINGVIQRIDKEYIYIELGKIEGIIPPSEQISLEKYSIGKRLKLYISEVKNSPKGVQVILSRTNSGLVTRLFELEIPEILDGVVEIFSIAREAGSRTKIAVFSKNENIDPVGACIGFKGARVKNIVNELCGEKIDIIVWDNDIKKFIKNSLSPAEIDDVIIDEQSKSATVLTPNDQLSLTIGKEGQNARLAAKLTGWKIDIKSSEDYNQI